MWPHLPIGVVKATTKGKLYDLGPYPAMTSGDDSVVGELWRFEFEQVAETLQVLDEIEDYRDSPNDLYKRVIVPCDVEGASVAAFTYHYALPLDESQRVLSINGGCSWPSAS